MMVSGKYRRFRMVTLFLGPKNSWWMPFLFLLLVGNFSASSQSHDESFLAYMDTTIQVAERLYNEYPQYKAEASFFLAAAYGFKGRLYSDEERKNWRKAATVGKNALNYLEAGRGTHNLSPELVFEA